MSDATISALLEELREVDFETWNTINIRCRFIEASYGTEFGQDFIQGCIQRAIAAREWGTTQVSHATWETGSRYICQIRLPGPFPLDFYGTATAPAAVILAAYIEAVRAMR